jgi:hypothetical protein
VGCHGLTARRAGPRAGASRRAPSRALVSDRGRVRGVPANVAAQCALVAHAAPRPLGLTFATRASRCRSASVFLRRAGACPPHSSSNCTSRAHASLGATRASRCRSAPVFLRRAGACPPHFSSDCTRELMRHSEPRAPHGAARHHGRGIHQAALTAFALGFSQAARRTRRIRMRGVGSVMHRLRALDGGEHRDALERGDG